MSDDTDESSVEVYKCGSKTATDSAANYILDEYERPEVLKNKDDEYVDRHRRCLVCLGIIFGEFGVEFN